MFQIKTSRRILFKPKLRIPWKISILTTNKNKNKYFKMNVSLIKERTNLVENECVLTQDYFAKTKKRQKLRKHQEFQKRFQIYALMTILDRKNMCCSYISMVNAEL